MHIVYVSGGYGKVCVIVTDSINTTKKQFDILIAVVVAFQKYLKAETVPKRLFAITAWHDGDSWLLS